MRPSKLLFKGAAIASLIVALALGATAFAVPPHPQLVPTDPGYQRWPYPLTQVNAQAFLWDTQGKQCTAPIAVIDSGQANIPDLPVPSEGINYLPGSPGQKQLY